MKICAVHIAVLLTLCACRKEPDSTDTKSKSTAANAAAEVESPTRVKPPADEGIDVPTEHDFDEAVATQITPESDLQKELDKLEQEIGQ